MAPTPGRNEGERTYLFLFGKHETLLQRAACIRYVGKTIRESYFGPPDVAHIYEEAPVAIDRLDLLLRLCAAQAADANQDLTYEDVEDDSEIE